MNECEKWLFEMLKKDEMILVQTIREKAKQEKFSKIDLKAARKSLGVKTFHQFDEKEATDNWFWHL